MVANCANASRFNSLIEEIYSACIPEGNFQNVGFNETKEAGIEAIGKAGLSHKRVRNTES